MCVVNILKSVLATPPRLTGLPESYGKTICRYGYQWRPTERNSLENLIVRSLNKKWGTEIPKLSKLEFFQIPESYRSMPFGILDSGSAQKQSNHGVMEIMLHGLDSVDLKSLFYMGCLGTTIYSLIPDQTWIKSKKSLSTIRPKSENTKYRASSYLFQMDLCGPMRVQSINGEEILLSHRWMTIQDSRGMG
ncbi:hypothetical protein Tco_0680897 [Tanacetum coccineum]|uniref:Uncharacterized protein n=1 Tax=Tanacetum coccineum TaxID=301880 RepID=A0ABQ4XN33_9ASTR